MNAPALPQEIKEGTMLTIAHCMLSPSPTNPRKNFPEKGLKELAETMKPPIGILQPIIVRPIFKKKDVAPASQTGKIRPEASWPFPTKGKPLPPLPKYTIDEKLYAERIAAGLAEMPGNSQPEWSEGMMARYNEIQEELKTAEPTGRYEIVAGERRWRAASIAKLKEVPILVRHLTDELVMLIQNIENIQREDLHPLEEAEGFERLMKAGYRADDLAEEVGKSRAYIYASLKLCALCPEARQIFLGGKLDASTALLIARIPVHKLQIQAMKKITAQAPYSSAWMSGGDTMSYRRARDLIQQEFMTDLSDAPFPIKDAKLLAKVGSCTDCTDRTGNQPELFDDVKSKDVCTNPSCFAMKKAAHILAIQKKAEDEGCEVITGKKAAAIIPHSAYSSKPEPKSDSGYARLDARCPHDPDKRTWGEVLKASMKPAKGEDKAAVQKVMIEDTHRHTLIPTISIEEATKALRQMGLEVKPIKNIDPASNNAAQEKEQAVKKAKRELANATRARLFDTLHKKIETDVIATNMNGLYRILAEYIFKEKLDDYDDAERIAKLYLPVTGTEEEGELIEAFEKHIHTMTTQQHFLLLIDMMMIPEIEAPHHFSGDLKKPETMMRIAAEIGIDAKAIEQQVIAETKAAAKAAAKPAKPAAKKATDATSAVASKPSSTPTPAAPAAAKSPKKKPATAKQAPLGNPDLSKPPHFVEVQA